MRYFYFIVAMLAGAVQAQSVLSSSAAKWLAPGESYTFLDAQGESVLQATLPSVEYRGWSIFNATTANQEEGKDYWVSSAADEDFATVGKGMLRFGGQLEGESTFLSLGISTNPDDVNQIPIEMTAIMDNVRVDNVYARVRFVECADEPDIEMLKEMYPTAAAREPDEQGRVKDIAAKMGLCVGPDGYFRVARVLSGTVDNPGTGLPEDYTFEFAASKYSYKDVGGGEVIVRIEFNTYENEDGAWRRAYRIFAKGATDDPDTSWNEMEEVCLTENRGYLWSADAQGNYQFDFSSIEKGEWLYALDDAIEVGRADSNVTDVDAQEVLARLDSLHRIAFSATDGGFYEAWLAQDTLPDVQTLATVNVKQFAPYVQSPNGKLYSLYTDWATKYNVNLLDYQPSVSLYAASTEADDPMQRAFDAFLLYMDPNTNEPLRLKVTGVVPEAETVAFTVTGPEGCNLRDAVTRAARLQIRRAATLAEFASAPAETYDIAFSADGTAASFVLPKREGEVEMPFMQATLVSIADAEVSADNK